MVPIADNEMREEVRSPIPRIRSTLFRLYVSHTLSAWSSRTFEFGAVLFLAAIFPGTLLYASIYALVRAAAATVFSSWVGNFMDASNRLQVIRHAIAWQRISVAISCLLFVGMLNYGGGSRVSLVSFLITVMLACVEKLGSIASTIALERDWVVVISEQLHTERQDANTAMRRIDLLCKLLAPLFVSFLDAYQIKIAMWVVFAFSTASVVVEYFAIEQVFKAVPALGRERTQPSGNEELPECDTTRSSKSIQNLLDLLGHFISPWITYAQSPIFLASFALSLLYLTVLSTGVQFTTYLLAVGFTSLQVSIARVAAVIVELLATWASPILTDRIGPIRSGLWFINWQLATLAICVTLFVWQDEGLIGSIILTSGIVLSRVGLWGFDLSVQFLIQEVIPESQRGSFSATEIALQNLFELLTFASTIVFPRTEQFRYPVYMSIGAVALSSICFATYVRKERGHLLHASRCLRRDKYSGLAQVEPEDRVSLQDTDDQNSSEPL